MRAVKTSLPEVLILEPRVFSDERGDFLETWNDRRFAEITGTPTEFVQDNQSRSRRGVLRGLHYQLVRPQGKLVHVIDGAVFDVAVDIRRNSDNFGKWFGVELTSQNRRQLWVPPGFAHGFYATSEMACVAYKVSDYYAQEWDRSIRWDDPELGIEWPTGAEAPLVSPKDAGAPFLRDAEIYE